MLSNLYLYTQPYEGRKDVWIKREMGWLAVHAHQVSGGELDRGAGSLPVNGHYTRHMTVEEQPHARLDPVGGAA